MLHAHCWHSEETGENEDWKWFRIVNWKAFSLPSHVFSDNRYIYPLMNAMICYVSIHVIPYLGPFPLVHCKWLARTVNALNWNSQEALDRSPWPLWYWCFSLDDLMDNSLYACFEDTLFLFFSLFFRAARRVTTIAKRRSLNLKRRNPSHVKWHHRRPPQLAQKWSSTAMQMGILCGALNPWDVGTPTGTCTFHQKKYVGWVIGARKGRNEENSARDARGENVKLGERKKDFSPLFSYSFRVRMQ